MATATLTQPAPPLSTKRPHYRFTVEQYHGMIDAGILTENDRVELLDGWVIEKMTHNPPHDCAIQLIQREFAPRLPAEFLMRIQSAITIPARSEPEPDIAVVRGPIRRYAKSHPRPRDIGMLVEVAESTLIDDRLKCQLYGRARIPIYWIVNLLDATLEVYTEPRPGRIPGYRMRQDFMANDRAPLIIEGREVAWIRVRDLLP